MTSNIKQFHPLLMLVWLLIIASIMLFAGFSSAYWVHMSDGVRNQQWLQFELPVQFWVSTGIVLFSGITMQLAYVAAKNDDLLKIPAFITITLLLGIGFCVSQAMAAQNLISRGLFLVNSEPAEISVSFIYVLAGVHLAHILIGLALLITGVVKASKLKIHKKDLVFIKICKTYWHFLGILWLYLILFFYFAG
jgi:cytochrome c oxidase subunit 3